MARATVENCYKWIQSGHYGICDAVKLNDIDGRIYVTGGLLEWERNGTKQEIRTWNGEDQANFYRRIERELIANKSNINSVPRDSANDALMIVAGEHKFNPVVDMLDKLPRWDGQTAPCDPFTLFLGVEPTDYNKQVVSNFMLGAVQRAYEPGCKYDYMIILRGAPGIGKSTFVQRLAMNDELYTDSIVDLTDAKASEERASGKWLVEIGELSALSGSKSVEAIKEAITRRSWDVRLPYDRHTTKILRSYVLIGTSNSAGIPNDHTGGIARRMLPIKCGEVECFSVSEWDEQGIDEIIQQAWAGVIYFYKECKRKGIQIKPTLPDYLLNDAQIARDAATIEDTEAPLILEFLDRARHEHGATGCPRVCVRMIAENALDMSPEEFRRGSKVTNKITDILNNKAKGWEYAGKQRVTYNNKQYGVCNTWEYTASHAPNISNKAT